MRMSELLNEVRRFELDEGFSPREIKMAIGIASDPRYAKGNMTGAVTAIERMKKGLSDHPQVAAVLKRQNEDLDEASKEGTIKIIKTKDGKFQIQKMTKGKFVDIGKPHNSAKEAEKFRSGQPDLFGEEVKIDELLVNNPNPNLDNKATWKRDPKQSNLKLPDKLSRHGKRSALAKMVPRMQNILTSVKEMDLDREQLQGVMNKASKLMIEIELAEKHTVVENLYHLDLDDVMQSSVLVKGVGRYSVEGLMQNIREKLDDLSQEARSMSPFDYKNIKSKLDSGIVSKMLDSLTQAFDDLENARRKGGPASRSIPKNIFDDTTLVELDLFRKKSTGPKQSTALAVLDNVANRSSQTPFPVRMYDKTVIEVTPKIAKQIIDLYDGSNDRVKGVIEDLLKTKNGFKELVQKVTKKR